jgi:N-acetylneuraminate synthase
MIFKSLVQNNVFFVAEISANHNGSLMNAKKLIKTAKDNGADAVKLQTYTPNTITINSNNSDFKIRGGLWHGQTLWDLYKKAHTPFEWHKELFNYAKKLKITCFSTPFDETAVDFLETLNCPFYKVASFEINHIPLIKRIAKTGKPIIISTGMATEEELDELVDAARKAGCKDLTLLKCTSTYPAIPENSNLLTIPYLKNRYGCEVGLSDHTLGIGVAVASVALGASVIEKHFTLKRSDGGVDAAFSIEPHEMKQLVEETARAWQSLGKAYIGPTEAEKSSIAFRRSLYIVKDLKAGDVLTKENVRAIRPGLGLPPKYLNQVLGKTIRRDLKTGTALQHSELIEDLE